MVVKRVLAIVGVCAVIAGAGTGLFLLKKHEGSIKPVTDKVGSTAPGSSSQTSSGDITVGNSSPSSGIQQAGGGNSGGSSTDNGSATGSSSSTVQEMTNPDNFAQYNAPKYADANQAFYANLQLGTGTELSEAGQEAVVVYKGWLTNGTLFDETKVNNKGQSEAFSFVYDASPEQVIPGWDETLGGMKAGGTRLLIIPPAAGYGSQAHDSIPANSVLIFEVQLVEVKDS